MLKKAAILLFVTLSLFLGCQKKKQDNTIKPGYGATGNPHPGAQTVTGNTTPTNPATENTSMVVGGVGWTNPTCGSTFSITLVGYQGSTNVTLSFAKPAVTATYAIAATPSGTTSCALTVVNAPNQPTGISWYGKSGTVVINTTTAAISAQLQNVVCAQKSFGFPVVTVNGVLGCSQ